MDSESRSPYLVHLTEPRPRWWRRKARREWDHKLAVTQALVDSLPHDEIDAQVMEAMKDLMLHGEAHIHKLARGESHA